MRSCCIKLSAILAIETDTNPKYVAYITYYVSRYCYKGHVTLLM